MKEEIACQICPEPIKEEIKSAVLGEWYCSKNCLKKDEQLFHNYLEVVLSHVQSTHKDVSILFSVHKQ